MECDQHFGALFKMAKKKIRGKYLPDAILERFKMKYAENLDHLKEPGFHDYVIRMMTARDFCDRAHKNPVDQVWFDILQHEGVLCGYPNLERNASDPLWKQFVTEMKDTALLPYTVVSWGQHKVSYKIDPALFTALQNTKEVLISKKDLMTLPANPLYLDLSDCKDGTYYDGAFILVVEGQVLVILVTKNYKMYSFYSAFQYRDGLTSFTDFPALQNQVLKELSFIDKGNDPDLRIVALRCCLQVLAYLSSSAADVSEKKKGTIVKKRSFDEVLRSSEKFQDVKEWNVGYRFGTTIRLMKESSNESSKADSHIRTVSHPSAPKRPHYRSAHWCVYHVGAGRKDVIRKWIPPILVHGTYGTEVTTSVIHKLEA